MRRVYKVADFAFSVALAGDRDPDRYLKSFAPFKAEGCPKEEELFEFAEDGSLPEESDMTFLEEDRNDMGRVEVSGGRTSAYCRGRRGFRTCTGVAPVG